MRAFIFSLLIFMAGCVGSTTSPPTEPPPPPPPEVCEWDSTITADDPLCVEPPPPPPDLCEWDSTINADDPLCVEPPPPPPSDTARTPSPISIKQIHSGHSLTDTAMFKGNWPGHGRYIWADADDIDGNDGYYYQSIIGKSTVPGSPIRYRWDNAPGYGQPDARHDIADWELLVITEGVPLNFWDGTGPGSAWELYNLDYMRLFVENTWNNGNGGNGATTLLYATWGNLDTPDVETWRSDLEYHQQFWEQMADYGGANLPDAAKVYIIPGNLLMMRFYDDIQAGVAPEGVTSIQDYYSDSIHASGLGSYGIALLHLAVIHHINPSDLPDPNYGLNPQPTPAQADYIKQVVWEVATSYERTGLTAGSTPPPPPPVEICEWDSTINADDPLCVEPPPPDLCEWDSSINADDPLCVEPPPPPPPEPGSKNTNSLGLNFSGGNYWDNMWTNIDIMKVATIVTGAQGVWNTDELDLVPQDSSGWPMAIPEGLQMTHFTYFPLGHGGDNPKREHGVYTLRWEGDGDISIRGSGSVIETGSNYMLFDFNEGGDAIFVTVTRINPDDHIRNIEVIMPGGICDDDVTQYTKDSTQCSTSYTALTELDKTLYYHPLVITDMMRFNTIRYMGYSGTNNQYRSYDWEDRSKTNDRSWKMGTGKPWEALIAISNISNTNLWINLPPQASLDYYRNVADMLKTQLNPNLRVYIEIGNEIWNWSYPFSIASAYMVEQGRLKWPGNTLDDWRNKQNYLGYKTVKTCQMFDEVFAGEEDRLHCVLGTQGGYTDIGKMTMECVLAAEELGGPCGSFVDSLSIAPYIGMGPDEMVSLINEPNVLDAVFERLNGEKWNNYITAIAENKATADLYGATVTVYESGQHLSMLGRTGGDNDIAQTEIVEAANRDPRMGELYDRMYNYWRDQNLDLNVTFAYQYNMGPHGAWGLKEYQEDTRSDAVKWNAIMSFLDANECWWAECVGND